jgi:2-methylcitrate dehydratase PrpD
MQDPAVLRLKGKVRLVPGAPGGRGAAEATRVPLIQITMADGTQFTQDTLGPVLGTAANPMSREQLIAKSRDLMSPVLGESQTTRLIEKVMSLEKSSNISELRRLLQRTSRNGAAKLSEYPFAK